MIYSRRVAEPVHPGQIKYRPVRAICPALNRPVRTYGRVPERNRIVSYSAREESESHPRRYLASSPPPRPFLPLLFFFFVIREVPSDEASDNFTTSAVTTGRPSTDYEGVEGRGHARGAIR